MAINLLEKTEKPAISRSKGNLDKLHFKPKDIVEVKMNDQEVDPFSYHIVLDSKDGKYTLQQLIENDGYAELGEIKVVPYDLIYGKTSYTFDDFYDGTDIPNTHAKDDYIKQQIAEAKTETMGEVYETLKGLTIRPLRRYTSAGDKVAVKDENIREARNSLMGVVKIKDDFTAQPIDEAYRELRDSFPHVFPDLDNEEDQLMQIAEVLQEAKQFKPKKKSIRKPSVKTAKPVKAVQKKDLLISWKQGALKSKKSSKLIPLWVTVKKQQGNWKGDYTIEIPKGREDDAGSPYKPKETIEISSGSIPEDVAFKLGIWSIGINNGVPKYSRTKLPTNAQLVKASKI